MKRFSLVKFFLTLIVAAVSLTTLAPFLWMISASFKYEADVFVFPVEWIPTQWNALSNYLEVWSSEYDMARMYINTIKVTLIVTVLDVIISAMAAYAFAKIEFKLKKPLFLLFLGCWMIPMQLTLIPRFVIIQNMGMYNSHEGLILMSLFSAYGVFLLRQNLVMIPDALGESAKIDGAGHWTIFTRIIMPIAKPSLATVAVLRFVWTWNDFQSPLVFLSSKELYTIQRGMVQFSNEQGVLFSRLMAASVCAIVPLFIVFVFAQKFVVEGIAGGAVKG